MVKESVKGAFVKSRFGCVKTSEKSVVNSTIGLSVNNSSRFSLVVKYSSSSGSVNVSIVVSFSIFSVVESVVKSIPGFVEFGTWSDVVCSTFEVV